MKNYKFTDDQINVILNTLAQQPYINVFELINNIQLQFKEQDNKQNNKELSIKESE